MNNGKLNSCKSFTKFDSETRLSQSQLNPAVVIWKGLVVPFLVTVSMCFAKKVCKNLFGVMPKTKTSSNKPERKFFIEADWNKKFFCKGNKRKRNMVAINSNWS